MKANRLALTLVVLCCCSTHAFAQSHGQPFENAPGVWHDGRFLGFVPKHLKVQAASPSSLGVADVAAKGSTIPANYTAPLPANDVAGIVSVADDDGTSEWPHDGECYDFGCREPFLWVGIDYLRWWTKGMSVPPLATTSPDGTPQDQAGVLGQPGTSILFGDQGINDESRSGARIRLGMWFDPCREKGIEITYIGLDETADGFLGREGDYAILARPFFDIEDNLQDSRLIAYPDLVEGTLSIKSSTDFQSISVLFQRVTANGYGRQIDYFLGYRYAELRDLVRVDEATRSLADPTLDATIDLFDEFSSENRFHGGEFGARILRPVGPCWSLELLGKIALGGTSAQTAISGQTVITTADDNVATSAGGLLAQPTNIGIFHESKFSTLTELDFNMRREFRSGMAATIGYTFIYWSDVYRAGQQIDLGINTSQIPPGELDGPARPAYPADSGSFWAQGLNFGLEFVY